MTVVPLSPTRAQLALLDLVLAAPEDRSARFEDWADRVDIDVLPDGSHGLLPAALRRCEAAGVDHPWMARLRGVYRRHWTAGQLARASAADARRVLGDRGIISLRPADQQLADALDDPTEFALGTVRVVVPWREADRAARALVEAGWRPDPAASGPLSARGRLTWSTRRFDRNGSPFELATFLNPHVIGPRRDAGVWERAAPTVDDGDAGLADRLVLALSDQSSVDGALRWVLPARALLTSAARPPDLVPVVDMAAARRVLPLLVARLDFLADAVGCAAAGPPARELAAVATRRPVDEGPTGAARRAWRATIRLPGATAEIVDRHGGVRRAVTVARTSVDRPY